MVHCYPQLCSNPFFSHQVNVRSNQRGVLGFIKVFDSVRWYPDFLWDNRVSTECKRKWGFSSGGVLSSPVGPQHSKQLGYPRFISFFQLLFQDTFDDLVDGFDMPIRLRVCWYSKPVGYPKLRAKILKFFIIELLVVVTNNCIRDPKSANEVLPNEFRGFSFCNAC